MQLKADFPILIAHPEVAAQSVAGVRLRQIQQEIERNGWKTIVVATREDAGIVAGAHRGLAAIAFGIEGARGDDDSLKRVVDRLSAVHERAPGLPIIALAENAVLRAEQPAAVSALRHVHRHPLPV